MIATLDNLPSAIQPERVVVAADHDDVAPFMRRNYPEFEVTAVESYLQAIGLASRHPVRAVMGTVDLSFTDLPVAVDGLREAVGKESKVLLCCRPEAEPMAREAVTHGADGYLILPLRTEEVDEALEYGRPPVPVVDIGNNHPTAAMSELNAFGDILAYLEAPPREMLKRAADWLRGALEADGVLVVVEGAMGRSGEWNGTPVLAQVVESQGQTVGQISVGPRSGRPYSTVDVHKLAHCALLTGQLLEAGRRQRQWQRLALVDELSDLPNRRQLLRFLEDVLTRAARERFRVTLLLFDLDDFKRYNDLCGHQAGDEIIRRVGQLFRKHCREHDLVTRYGGDEFAVVFWDAEPPRVPGSKHPTEALTVLRRFKEALKNTDWPQSRSLENATLTISGGLASFPWDATTVEQLIARADEALLLAKRAGKNCVYLIGDEREPPLDAGV